MSAFRKASRTSLLSRRAVLAVAAVVDVALHARPEPVSARAMADRHALPHRHLEQVLQTLVHADILRSIRGPRGGYELVRERRRVSVGEIVRAVGPDAEDPGGTLSGWHLVDDVIGPAVRDAEDAFLVQLDAITIQDLCARARTDTSPDTVELHDIGL